MRAVLFVSVALLAMVGNAHGQEVAVPFTVDLRDPDRLMQSDTIVVVGIRDPLPLPYERHTRPAAPSIHVTDVEDASGRPEARITFVPLVKAGAFEAGVRNTETLDRSSPRPGPRTSNIDGFGFVYRW